MEATSASPPMITTIVDLQTTISFVFCPFPTMQVRAVLSKKEISSMSHTNLLCGGPELNFSTWN
jgi:hypothetical protein